jgi:hypothetical protein
VEESELIFAGHPARDFLAHTPFGRVAAGGQSALRSLCDRSSAFF